MADNKKPFMTRLIEKRIEPIIDNLLYTCFYYYVDSTGNPNKLTFESYCSIIRDLLKCSIDRKEV